MRMACCAMCSCSAPGSKSEAPGSCRSSLADRARYEISADSSTTPSGSRTARATKAFPGRGMAAHAFRRADDAGADAGGHLARQAARRPAAHRRRSWVPPIRVSAASCTGASRPCVITLALGLLAVPLSKLRPRQGRYSRVIWAVLLFRCLHLSADLRPARCWSADRRRTGSACGGCMSSRWPWASRSSAAGIQGLARPAPVAAAGRPEPGLIRLRVSGASLIACEFFDFALGA